MYFALWRVHGFEVAGTQTKPDGYSASLESQKEEETWSGKMEEEIMGLALSPRLKLDSGKNFNMSSL